MPNKQLSILDSVAIAAANRILARGDEVKISMLKDGVRVSAVKYKTEYKILVDKDMRKEYNQNKLDNP